MKTPALIIETLGVDALTQRLGVAKVRVLRARYGSTLPASWYAVVCDMATEAGLAVPPRSAFSFKASEAAA
jgi:hypothetical protein